MRRKERRDGKKIGTDGKVPQDEESWKRGHVMS